MKIVFIGSGNIAHFFAGRLHNKGHEIIQVYSRTKANGSALASLTGASVTDRLDDISTEADLYILAVKDDVLQQVAGKLDFGSKPVIHCAGAVSLDVIQHASEKRAVIWALYSIQKNNLPRIPDVPLIVEGSDREVEELARSIALDISTNVVMASYKQRQVLHLNAVFANNFTNHLLAITESICADNALPFSILHPIIVQTVQQLSGSLPSERQTGPAVRHDQDTMNKHLELLAQYSSKWQEIYRDISASIQQMTDDKQEQPNT